MAYPNFCNICSKRTKLHDRTLKCNTCQTKVHINCLPIYSDSDSEYAAIESNHWSCTVCLQTLFPYYDSESHNLHSFNDVDDSTFDIDCI
jgi:hypothetical protein